MSHSAADPSQPVTICLVTGATGFLGGHLVDVLLEAGTVVRALVRRDSNTRRLSRQKVDLVWGDATDKEALRRAVEGAAVVFHAAGYVTADAPFSGAEGATDPQERALYQTVNIDFTAALLAASLAAGVQRFVYLSSSSVYALNAPVPTPEDAPLEPLSFYGRSKLAAENLVRAYEKQGLPATIVRPPIAYGPRDRAFTPLALRLARLPILPLINGGRALLDLVYARDVAELLWRAAHHPRAAGRVYNAGPGRPTSLRDLVAAYQRITGAGPRIVPVSPSLAGRSSWLSQRVLGQLVPEAKGALTPQGLALMTRDLHLSMSRAAAELDFRPRYGLEAGLGETITTDGRLRPG